MKPSTHPHWRGLDGLRAIAVIAVVIYHFSPMTLPGGYLGVDIFFVISGYLITRLIVTEFAGRRRIDAPAFYQRRARRLLPALGIVLVAVGASALLWRDQLASVRPGIAFSALFGANWWLAFDHQPYFVATGRPSMLQHLWSLGVEEQFYLFWPLIVAATLGASRRRLTRRGGDPAAPRRLVAPLIAVAGTLALLSTGLTWLLADSSNVPYGSDGSTLYYGTDTHSMGLLLGAALGAWAAGRSPSGATDVATRRAWIASAYEVVGLSALVAVLVLTRAYDGYSHSLYRGGFLLVAALVAVVIAAATRPASRLGAALDLPPLRWIGVRSYSIYLWHWPVAVVTRPGLDTSMPTWLDQALRVALTVALADATYRLVERPVRRLGFRGACRALVGRLRRAANPLARPAFAVASAVPVLAIAVLVVAPPAPRSAAALSTRGGTHLSLDPPTSAPHHRGSRAATRTKSAQRMPKISGFGDSVMLDARRTLAHEFGGGSIDAVVGRQPGPILDDIARDARARSLNPVVIIHAGNNGLIDPDQLERTLRLLSSARSKEVKLILVLNDHLDPYDHSWQTPNNKRFAKVVPHFAKARLINWDKLAGKHPGWLYSDDLHLRPAGADHYAKLLADAYRTWRAAHPHD
ncbi:MAG TPA: acyltransferase family protein [Mycobacteriales bacterium]|jgi:peptidoglycan/LPS O-acetylase OafA/YrhL|nr:acyltransferase family protein [Mycobacteriales bacterium]